MFLHFQSSESVLGILLARRALNPLHCTIDHWTLGVMSLTLFRLQNCLFMVIYHGMLESPREASASIQGDVACERNASEPVRWGKRFHERWAQQLWVMLFTSARAHFLVFTWTAKPIAAFVNCIDYVWNAISLTLSGTSGFLLSAAVRLVSSSTWMAAVLQLRSIPCK